MMRLLTGSLLAVGLVLLLAGQTLAHNAKADVIEDINAKQLENLVAENDYVAVYWYKRSCKDCDKVLGELETIDDDTDRFGVHFVKVADKKLAKSYGVKVFPSLSFFRNKEPMHYEGDLMDEGSVLEFLTSLEAMDLPDQIEEVNAKILDKIVEEQEFVAVLFCYDGESCIQGEHKSECRRCVKVLQELENVDDDADQLGIAFVKINDPELADEYSLGSLPALVYYRKRIPVVYDGDLMNEDKVLEWLVENKNTGEDDDVIDDVTLGLLNTLIDSVDHLAVIFYDRDESDDSQILLELESIDDDLDSQGIHIVKIADEVAAKEYGIEDTPCLVYFENEIPSLYDGNLHNEEEVLAWLIEQLQTDEIEDVTDEMLDKLIREANHLAVLFYDEDDQDSQLVVNELENIDDECDAKGVSFVKIDNDEEAKEYGIDTIPSLVYFEKGIPSLYSGNLLAEDEVLDWLVHQVEDDEIEEVTDEMLDRLIDKAEHLAVLFFDKDSRRSRKVLAELENIDDECDSRGIFFVKIDNFEEAKEYGIETIPTLVYFESEIPYIFEGDLMKEEEVLAWLIHHVEHEEIADVTDEMLDKLIVNEPFLAVLFYDKDDEEDHEVLGELENIDDDCEQAGIPFVKIDNDAEAKEYGIEELPTLVYFENRIPSIYEGDLSNEQEVLAWLVEQKNTDTIEEVTDEILDDLIANFEYVVVYFSGKCEEGQKCDKILDELEKIDDDTDDHGMHFVTTEESSLANQHGIKTFPALALFRNGEPVIYKGDISDEDAVLKWLTDDDTLEIPNKIEEVNQRMLERILNTSDNVAVYFYSESDKKSKMILTDLENIDDECDDIGIDFVKISDDGIAEEYDIVSMPALVYFRTRFPQIYEGDLQDEEAVLEWLIDNKDKGPASIIEEVDGQMLQNLIDSFEYIVVYFYDDNCPTCETVLAELETIDDETDEVGIQFVKTNDVEVAEDLGISHLPALVYFEGGVPSIYDGDIAGDDEVYAWLIAETRILESSVITKSLRHLLGVEAEDGDDEGEDIDVGEGDDDDEEEEEVDSEVEDEDVDDDEDENDGEADEDDDVDEVEAGDEEKDDAEDDDDEEDEDDDEEEDDDDEEDGEDDNEAKAEDNEVDEEEEDEEDEDDDDVEDSAEVKAGEDDDDDDEDDDKDDGEVESDDDDKVTVEAGDENDETEAGDDESDAADDDDETGEEVEADDDDDDDESDEVKADDDDESDEVEADDDEADDVEDDDDDDDDDESDEVEADDDDDEAEADDDDNETVEAEADDGDDDDEDEDDDDDDDAEEDEVEADDDDEDDADDEEVEAADDDGEDAEAGEAEIDSLEAEADGEDDDDDDDEEETVAQADEDDDDDGNESGDEDETIAQDDDDDDEDEDDEEDEAIAQDDDDDDEDEEDEAIAQDDDDEDEDEAIAQDDDDDEDDEEDEAIAQDDDDDDEDEEDDEEDEAIDQDDDDDDDEEDDEEEDEIVAQDDEDEEDEAEDESEDEAEEIEDAAADEDAADDEEEKVEGEEDDGEVVGAAGEDDDSDSDIQAEEEVLEWLIEQRHEDTIENINRQMLYTLIDTQDYLSVYFFNDENDECPKVLRVLEKIDDEAAEYGIQMVKMNDRLMAKKYGFRNPPGLVYFRKAKHIKYDGDLYDEEDVLDWLTAPENMELNDAIEKVNRKMFERIRQTTDYLAVFFYAEEGCKQCQKVLAELENIDDEADANGIDFVKIDDAQLAKEVGVYALPAIVFYRAGTEDPIIYAGGDMKNEENLLSWLLTEKDPTADFIEDMEGDALQRVIRDSDAIAVYFYDLAACGCEDPQAEPEKKKKKKKKEQSQDKNDSSCETCMQVLEELENIDDDTDRIGVSFVKTQDTKIAERYGVTSLPALLYFEHQVPTVFEGDLLAEEDVLQWLILQKTEDTIETVNRNMLEVMLEDTQYLAVFFSKPNCRACETVLAELENIDDECDLYGIHMVKIQDAQLAKRYGIKTLPALIYFRNGNPLIFDGDMKNEVSVLEWLTDDDNRELDGEIEAVNVRMLYQLMDESPFIAVFFYEDDCPDCEQVLQELENIDDEVDMFGIDFVKINDPDAAQRFNILHTPALVYFRKKTPLVYDGDLLDEEKVFKWLTSQDVFEIKDEIEEVNRKMLEKLLDENDFVAVYFYEESARSEEVLEELEKIDDETDDLDITFVKIRDTRYAKKYGIQKLPALVYFRRRFPSIYRGDLMAEEEVLEWLQKNRFKHPELNLFMYATGAITFAFIMYTLFLIFCFKNPVHQKAA
ncbi:uncharacterized protein hlk isoform X4 [Panulirus ornatus]|uniref:uncharacterized protein hlk isoform X4 n=1 Tax=Panulirus ornatus TaxID=150431 RepID=UPI003A8A4CD9